MTIINCGDRRGCKLGTIGLFEMHNEKGGDGDNFGDKISIFLENLPKGRTGLSSQTQSHTWEPTADGKFLIESYRVIEQTEVKTGNYKKHCVKILYFTIF